MNQMKRSAKQEVGHFVSEIEAAVAALPVRNAQGLRAVRRRFSGQLKDASADLIMAIADRLVENDGSAYRFLAYEMLLNHKAALNSIGPREVARLGRNLDNWGAVDTFACYVSGPAWRQDQLSDRFIHSWARSGDRWLRRAAVVSTVPLNSKAQGGAGDANRTLALCRLVVGDRDDMVVKALSWALRELAKRDPDAVRRFLARHERDLAPTVLREVRNKLSTGTKSGRNSRARSLES